MSAAARTCPGSCTTAAQPEHAVARELAIALDLRNPPDATSRSCGREPPRVRVLRSPRALLLSLSLSLAPTCRSSSSNNLTNTARPGAKHCLLRLLPPLACWLAGRPPAAAAGQPAARELSWTGADHARAMRHDRARPRVTVPGLGSTQQQCCVLAPLTRCCSCCSLLLLRRLRLLLPQQEHQLQQQLQRILVAPLHADSYSLS
jgi:hypothetical protein